MTLIIWIAAIVFILWLMHKFINKVETPNKQQEPEETAEIIDIENDDDYIDWDTGTKVKIIHTKK